MKITVGIAPQLLVDQVRSAAPWIFDLPESLPYISTLKQVSASAPESAPKSAPDYFRLCISAHWASVATFVPTDVDNHIRFKLWHQNLSENEKSDMAQLVLQALNWDVRLVTARRIVSPLSGEGFSGHEGEWFSVAVAAYGAVRKFNNALASKICHRILQEMNRQGQIFEDLLDEGCSLEALQATALIAHNLGDLDRVIEQWNLPESDPLRSGAYKKGHHTDVTTSVLSLAGSINKTLMSPENHRHFALREPRCLRRSAELLLPLGPFFDGWGRCLVRHPLMRSEDIAEVVQTLVDGWGRLPATVGYARALAGIIETYPGGINKLCLSLPSRIAKSLKSGSLKSLLDVSQNRFEDQWVAKLAAHAGIATYRAMGRGKKWTQFSLRGLNGGVKTKGSSGHECRG